MQVDFLIHYTYTYNYLYIDILLSREYVSYEHRSIQIHKINIHLKVINNFQISCS